jgi:hypothetical protein
MGEEVGLTKLPPFGSMLTWLILPNTLNKSLTMVSLSVLIWLSTISYPPVPAIPLITASRPLAITPGLLCVPGDVALLSLLLTLLS